MPKTTKTPTEPEELDIEEELDLEQVEDELDEQIEEQEEDNLDEELDIEEELEEPVESKPVPKKTQKKSVAPKGAAPKGAQKKGASTTKKTTTKKTSVPKKSSAEKEKKPVKEGTVGFYRRKLLDSGVKLGSNYRPKNELIALYNETFGENVSLKKKKKKKEPVIDADGNEVKSPNTAYIAFSTDMRPLIKTKFPDEQVTDTARRIGAIWGAANTDELKKLGYSEKDILSLWSKKESYKKAYEKAKQEYDAKVAEIKQTQPKLPKRARSSYILFGTEVREKIKKQYPDKNSKELTAAVADEWKKLSEKEKAKYTKLYEEDKARYEQEMAEYVEQYGEPEKKTKAKNGDSKPVKKSAAAPKKTAPKKSGASNPAKKSGASNPAKKSEDSKPTKKSGSVPKKSGVKKTAQKKNSK